MGAYERICWGKRVRQASEQELKEWHDKLAAEQAEQWSAKSLNEQLDDVAASAHLVNAYAPSKPRKPSDRESKSSSHSRTRRTTYTIDLDAELERARKEEIRQEQEADRKWLQEAVEARLSHFERIRQHEYRPPKTSPLEALERRIREVK